MSNYQHSMQVPITDTGAGANGDPVGFLKGLVDRKIRFVVAAGNIYKVQGSTGNSNGLLAGTEGVDYTWVDLVTAINASGDQSIPLGWNFLRIVCTDDSGANTDTAILTGRMEEGC